MSEGMACSVIAFVGAIAGGAIGALAVMAYALFWTPTERLRRRVERLRLEKDLAEFERQ
jgi:uncharacterized protein (DUF697 family)